MSITKQKSTRWIARRPKSHFRPKTHMSRLTEQTIIRCLKSAQNDLSKEEQLPQNIVLLEDNKQERDLNCAKWQIYSTDKEYGATDEVGLSVVDNGVLHCSQPHKGDQYGLSSNVLFVLFNSHKLLSLLFMQIQCGVASLAQEVYCKCVSVNES